MPRLKALNSGSGIPLVFLHGFLGSFSDWIPLSKFLPSFPIFAIDLPGHGETPFQEEVEIELPYFHLIGYSLGGRIAMGYAKKHPEKIASLQIISAHPGLKTKEEKKKRLIHDQKWADLLLEVSIDEFLMRWYDQPIFRPFAPDLSMRKKQNIAALRSALLHFSLGKQERFQIAQAYVGERDLKFLSLYPNPIVIPNSGHMVHLENPKALADQLQRRLICV